MKVTAVVPSYEPDEKLIQVVDGLLRAVGVDLDERIDVVESSSTTAATKGISSPSRRPPNAPASQCCGTR